MYELIIFLKTDYFGALRSNKPIPSLLNYLKNNTHQIPNQQHAEAALRLIIVMSLIGKERSMEDIQEYRDLLVYLKPSNEYIQFLINDLVDGVLKDDIWCSLSARIADSEIRSFWIVELSKQIDYNIDMIFPDVAPVHWTNICRTIELDKATKMHFRYCLNTSKK